MAKSCLLPTITNWKSRLVYCVVATFIFAFAAHGFCLTNVFYSHDELILYSTHVDQVAAGRWLGPIVAAIRGPIESPWLIGIIAILWLSLSVYMITDLFSFNTTTTVMIAGIMATNITVIALFATYMHDADLHMLALFCSCAAVVSMRKFPSPWNVIGSIFFIVCTLGLYQAYIDVTIGLFVMMIIRDAFDPQTQIRWPQLFVQGVLELLCLLVGAILYFILFKISLPLYNTQIIASNYNSPIHLRDQLTVTTLLCNVRDAYALVAYYFASANSYTTVLIVLVNIMFGMVFVFNYSLCIKKIKRVDIGNIVLGTLLLAILPLALNAIFLVSAGFEHQLMVFSFVMIYSLPFIFDTNSWETTHESRNLLAIIPTTIVSCLCVIIIWNNIVYANGAYIYKKLMYDNTVEVMQDIWHDINVLPDYNEDSTTVVFMGDFSNSKALYKNALTAKYENVLTGASNASITYEKTVRWFFRYVMGKEIILSFNNLEVSGDPSYGDMPCYPCDGYCTLIDNQVVVKLSEE